MEQLLTAIFWLRLFEPPLLMVRVLKDHPFSSSSTSKLSSVFISQFANSYRPPINCVIFSPQFSRESQMPQYNYSKSHRSINVRAIQYKYIFSSTSSVLPATSESQSFRYLSNQIFGNTSIAYFFIQIQNWFCPTATSFSSSSHVSVPGVTAPPSNHLASALIDHSASLNSGSIRNSSSPAPSISSTFQDVNLSSNQGTQ